MFIVFVCGLQRYFVEYSPIFWSTALFCGEYSFDIIKYNPFHDKLKTSADDANKPYLNYVISHDTIETLSCLSLLLENCTTESIESLNENFKSHNELKHEKSVSFKFLNIDGNASNFDSLATSLQAINLKFSVVGIAETNVDPSAQ